MTAATPVAGGDVAKPGTTPADPTSRPIIVGHAPAPDPMVSTAQGSITKNEGEPAPQMAVTSGSMKSKIAPTASQEEVVKEATKENDAKLAEESKEKKQDTAAETATRLNEIIEGGEYNVTIHQKNSGSAVQFIAVVLGVVLVAAIIMYLLIDLNIIDAGVKLPFELFK